MLRSLGKRQTSALDPTVVSRVLPMTLFFQRAFGLFA